MEFSRQEYWSDLPFPSPGDLSNPGIKSQSPALQADSLPLSHEGSPNLFLLLCSIPLCEYSAAFSNHFPVDQHFVCFQGFCLFVFILTMLLEYSHTCLLMYIM